MLKKTVRKLWQGRFVSVRDYDIDEGISKGGMVITFEGRQMVLSRDDLKKILSTLPFTNPPIKSKTGGRNYRLVDITWKPAKIDTNQKEFFDV